MKILLAMSLLVPSLSLANGRVIPNGGDYVVCPARNARSEIFSAGRAFFGLFEIKSGYRYTYHALAKFRALDLETAFPLAVEKFFGRSVYLQERLLEHFANRDAELRFVTGKLGRVPELSLNALLQGCETRAFAIQYTKPTTLPGVPLVIEISREAWESAPTDLKLALLFHEYIFGEQLNAGGDCAHPGAALLVGSVLSDQAAGFSLEEWSSLWDPTCRPGL